jgi:hypothetical protein
VKISGKICSEFVEELPELEEIYSGNPNARAVGVSDAATPQSRLTESPTASAAVDSIASEDQTFAARSSSRTPQSLFSDITTLAKRRRTNESDRASFHSIGQTASILSYHERTHSFEDPVIRQDDAIDSLLRAADFSEHRSHQIGPLGSPSQSQIRAYAEDQNDTPRPWPHVNIQEACLMRYFIDKLACWVSLAR